MCIRDRIWAAAVPTLSTGGSAIVNSTPKGLGNFYHSTWVDAINVAATKPAVSKPANFFIFLCSP